MSLTKEEHSLVRLSALGGMLELYDFAIYGTFSIYFIQKFFPSGNSLLTMIETLSVLLLGFVLRPLGGILFSILGDKNGRKNILIITVFIMGFSSLGIAFLPTYVQVGLLAPILLIILRLFQGLAVGGEVPTTFVFLEESLSEDKKIYAFSIAMSGIFCGYLLAFLLQYLLINSFSDKLIEDYIWRVPFIVGGVLCFISFFIRKNLHETNAFKEIEKKQPLPFSSLFTKYKVNLLIGIFISATQQVYSILAIIFMPNYLFNFVKLEHGYINHLMVIIVIATVLVCIITGLLSNKVSNFNLMYRKILLINLVIIATCFFLMKLGFILSGLLIFMIGHGVTGVFVPLNLSRLFPTKIRLRGVAMSYNISILVLGGTIPVLITYLIKVTNGVYWVPALILSSIMLITWYLFSYLQPNVDA